MTLIDGGNVEEGFSLPIWIFEKKKRKQECIVGACLFVGNGQLVCYQL